MENKRNNQSEQKLKPKYLTKKEAASYLSICVRTLEWFLNSGQIRFFRLPGRFGSSGARKMVRISVEELEKFMTKHRVNEFSIDSLIGRGCHGV